MGFLKTLAGNILRDVVRPELEALTKDLVAKVTDAAGKAQKALQAADAAVTEVRTLKAQMSALMALDVGFKEMGKVILLTRIGDQDRVKIIDVKPTMTVADYQILVERLKHDFGVGDPVYLDEPRGHHLRDILVDAGTIAPVRRGVRSR